MSSMRRNRVALQAQRLPYAKLNSGAKLTDKPAQQPVRLVNGDFSHRDFLPASYDLNLLADQRVLKTLLDLETLTLANPDYFHSVQVEVQPEMRKVVTQWMLEVCEEEQLEPEVFVSAVNYLDRFLSVEAIHKSQLQLLGAACLFIASKLRLTQPLTAKKLIAYTDHSVNLDELMSWELLILGRLNWDTQCPTAYDFVDHILYRLNLPSTLTQRVKDLIPAYIAAVATEFSLALLPPSILASGCVCVTVENLLGTKALLPVLIENLRGISSLNVEPYISAIESFAKRQFSHQSQLQCYQWQPSSPGPHSNGKPSQNPTLTPTDIQDVQLVLC